MPRPKLEKELQIVIKATPRKAKALEKAIRIFLNEYEDLAGVYDISVQEVNHKYYINRDKRI